MHAPAELLLAKVAAAKPAKLPRGNSAANGDAPKPARAAATAESKPGNPKPPGAAPKPGAAKRREEVGGAGAPASRGADKPGDIAGSRPASQQRKSWQRDVREGPLR